MGADKNGENGISMVGAYLELRRYAGNIIKIKRIERLKLKIK